MTGARSAGVTAIAVVVFLGSAFAALSGLVLLLTATVGVTSTLLQAPAPNAGFLRVVIYGMCGVMLGLTVWGIATGVGLLRLRPWARLSMLAFAALLAANGVLAGLALVFLPIPIAEMPPEAPEGTLTAVQVGTGLVYAVLAALGGFWLYYFNRSAVRQQFAAAVPPLPRARPLPVTVIAWFLLLGGILGLGVAWLPLPGIALGLVFRGWAATAYYVALAGFQIWLGVGLLRLNPLSHTLAIAYFVYTVINQVLFLALPGLDNRLYATLDWLPAGWPGAGGISPGPSLLPGLLSGIVFGLVPLFFLLSGRWAFRKPA
jgi:hypothetical protein